MSLDDLGQWYYLIYLLPLALSVLMIVASAFGGSHRAGHGGLRMGHGHGGIRFGHGHGGIHAGGGHGRIAHSGASRTAHASARTAPRPQAASAHRGSQSRGTTRGNQHKEAEGSELHLAPTPNPLLSFFGIGKVPALLLAQGFGLSWGVVGFYATRLFQQSGSGGLGFVLPAAGMAAAGGVLGAKLIGEIGSRLMPSEESFAVGKEDLLGLIGTVVYPVSGGMGRIHIYDAYGTLHDESARLLPDQTEDIGKGESVIVVDYDEASHCFLVESSPV